MKRGYNELVGIQVTFSRVVPRYRTTLHYRWRANGKTERKGTLRGFDLPRDLSCSETLRDLSRAYAPAVVSRWYNLTDTNFEEYLQLHPGATPNEMEIDGEWYVWIRA